MKIVFLSPPLMKKEARSLIVSKLAETLQDKGEETIICSEKRKNNSLDSINSPHVTYQKKIFSLITGPLKSLKKYKIGAIHIFGSSPLWIIPGIILKIKKQKPKLIYSLSSYPIIKDSKINKEKLWIKYLKNSGHWLLNYADYVTVSSKNHANYLIKKGVKKNKIRIVRSFIDHTKFVPKNKLKLKSRYNLKDKIVILYYGSLWEAKGSETLIKSVPEIAKISSKIHFVFIPRNLSYAIKYKYRLEEQWLGKQIQFITEDVKIEDYVALADLVVLPYPHLEGTEGNPSCLLESMACKTPVVTTDLPELKEIVDGCVFMAKPGNVDSLIETIKFALNNPSPKMVERAYQKSKEFDVKKISEAFLDLYKN